MATPARFAVESGARAWPTVRSLPSQGILNVWQRVGPGTLRSCWPLDGDAPDLERRQFRYTELALARFVS